MFRRTLRLVALLCLFFGALTLLPIAATAAMGMSGDVSLPAFEGSTLPSPTPTYPPGTLPTAAPTEEPPQPTSSPTMLPHPTATAQPPYPTVVPLATAQRSSAATSKGVASIGRYPIIKVIGQRLSPVIYAYTDRGRLYWSPEDGRDWRYVTTDPPVDQFIMSAADPNVLYSGAGVDCTVDAAPPAPFYRSDFRGSTWEELPTAVDLIPYLVDPNDPYRVFAADCELPFLSEDGGENWLARPDGRSFPYWFEFRLKDMIDAPLTVSGAGPTWDNIYAGGALDSGNSLVAVTQTEGNTWSVLSPLDGSGPIGLRVLEADPYVAGRLWAADAQGVWATNDWGATWTLISEGLDDVISVRGRASYGQITDLAYAPATGKLFLASTMGLYVLEPGSRAFTLLPREDFGRQAISSLLVTESNPSTLWINAATGAYRYRIR